MHSGQMDFRFSINWFLIAPLIAEHKIVLVYINWKSVLVTGAQNDCLSMNANGRNTFYKIVSEPDIVWYDFHWNQSFQVFQWIYSFILELNKSRKYHFLLLIQMNKTIAERSVEVSVLAFVTTISNHNLSTQAPGQCACRCLSQDN